MNYWWVHFANKCILPCKTSSIEYAHSNPCESMPRSKIEHAQEQNLRPKQNMPYTTTWQKRNQYYMHVLRSKFRLSVLSQVQCRIKGAEKTSRTCPGAKFHAQKQNSMLKSKTSMPRSKTSMEIVVWETHC